MYFNNVLILELRLSGIDITSHLKPINDQLMYK